MVVDEIVADIHIRCLPHVLDVLSKATHLIQVKEHFKKINKTYPNEAVKSIGTPVVALSQQWIGLDANLVI